MRASVRRHAAVIVVLLLVLSAHGATSGRTGRDVTGPLVAESLSSLASQSDLVIVGEVVSGLSFPTQDRLTTSTMYQVRVLEAPKDAAADVGSWKASDSPEDRVINIVMPAGRVMLPDSVALEGPVSNRTPLAAGERYVFFLERIERAMPASRISPLERSAYVPRRGARGMFQLTDEGVKPRSRAGSPVARAYAGTPSPAFIERVRAAAR